MHGTSNIRSLFKFSQTYETNTSLLTLSKNPFLYASRSCGAVQPALCDDGNSIHMLLLSFIPYGFTCYHKPTFRSPLLCDRAVTYQTAAGSGIYETMECTFF